MYLIPWVRYSTSLPPGLDQDSQKGLRFEKWETVLMEGTEKRWQENQKVWGGERISRYGNERDERTGLVSAEKQLPFSSAGETRTSSTLYIDHSGPCSRE